MNIQTKRVYEAPSRTDGYRVLVDRLWPRGLTKADAALDEWAKDLAPSDDLRKRFCHDADKWGEFIRRYTSELAGLRDQAVALVNRCPKKTITLLYAAKDAAHNNALVLKDFIETAIAT